jgi:tetratricopeptide (TPR) repeat protein
MRRRGQTVSPVSAAGLLCILATLLNASCGGVAFKDSLRDSARFPVTARVEEVPFYAQDDYQCGPAALAMVLSWSGINIGPGELSPKTYTPGNKGSLQSALIAAARRHGRIAYSFSGPDMLFTEIATGRPVIVLLNLAFAWYPKWHYAVVIGYDRNDGTVTMHSGERAAEQLSFRVFRNVWQRSDYWGLAILPPTETVEHPDEEKWLAAIVGLERAGQWHAAATAYEKAVELWPHSHNAWIGMGNSRCSLGDPAGAAAAYQEAIKVRPASGIAYNNLAQVLAQTGQYEEAEKAARQAVSLGGLLQETYARTLNEILRGRQLEPPSETTE